MNNENYILIVDDSQFYREIIKKIIKKEYNVNFLEAENGIEALNVYNKYKDKIKLIITDINMPEMDGLDLVENLVKKLNYNPFNILVMTAMEDDIFKIVLNHIGLNSKYDFILKNNNTESFLSKVNYKLNNQNFLYNEG